VIDGIPQVDVNGDPLAEADQVVRCKLSLSMSTDLVLAGLPAPTDIDGTMG
jgi:hypothetical protein